MKEGKTQTVTLELNMEPNFIEQVVREGRLTEFINAFSQIASDNIKASLVSNIAQASATSSKLEGSVQMVFELDEKYGTPYPRPPIPWPIGGILSIVIEEQVRKIVDERMALKK